MRSSPGRDRKVNPEHNQLDLAADVDRAPATTPRAAVGGPGVTASRHRPGTAGLRGRGTALPVQLELVDATPLRVLPPEPYDPRYDVCGCAGYGSRE